MKDLLVNITKFLKGLKCESNKTQLCVIWRLKKFSPDKMRSWRNENLIFILIKSSFFDPKSMCFTCLIYFFLVLISKHHFFLGFIFHKCTSKHIITAFTYGLVVRFSLRSWFRRFRVACIIWSLRVIQRARRDLSIFYWWNCW